MRIVDRMFNIIVRGQYTGGAIMSECMNGVGGPLLHWCNNFLICRLHNWEVPVSLLAEII
jgi:hypothetical protein